jgi:hypothetical protein
LSPTHYIFNHVPKTGGTSLLAVCRDNLEPTEISPHLDDHEIRLRPAVRFENYRLIAGHFSLLTQMEFCRNRYSMTLLRDPIKRIFSAYTFWRMATERNLFTSKAKELSFADFVRYFKDSPSVIYNPYCHHFAAIGKDCPGYPTDTAALLATAKHNLAAFDFVGICEELRGSIRLLCNELGWRCPAAVPHENRSSSETWLGEVEPQTMEVLRDRNQLDSELYEYAVHLFHAHESAAAAKSETAFPRLAEPNRFVPLPAPLKMARSAIIRSVSAMWVPDQASRTLEVGVNFTTIAPAAELSLGALVTDADGRIVWGTSTANENLNLDCEVGCDSCAAFLMECELPAGVYSVTVALSEQRRLGFHEHWIDRAGLFTVAPPEVSVSPCAHSVRLQQFWSTASQGRNNTRPPWRSESRSQGQVADRGLLETSAVGIEASQASRSLSPSPMNPRTGFHPQGFLDVDAKISNPRVRLQLAHNRVDMQSENRRRVYVMVTNLSNETFSSRYAFPVKLSYHWMSNDQQVKQLDGLRSSLPFDILPGCSATVEAIIEPPPDSSSSLICITLVQEHVCWFDDFDSANRLILHLDGLEALAA